MKPYHIQSHVLWLTKKLMIKNPVKVVIQIISTVKAATALAANNTVNIVWLELEHKKKTITLNDFDMSRLSKNKSGS